MPIGARPYVTHWQDWMNFVLGLWLFVSPWVLGFARLEAAAWNCWLVGVVVAAVSVSALIQFARWEEWINAAAGLWLLVSPWLLAFAGANEAAALWNHVLVGLAVAVLALWDGFAHREERVWVDDF